MPSGLAGLVNILAKVQVIGRELWGAWLLRGQVRKACDQSWHCVSWPPQQPVGGEEDNVNTHVAGGAGPAAIGIHVVVAGCWALKRNHDRLCLPQGHGSGSCAAHAIRGEGPGIWPVSGTADSGVCFSAAAASVQVTLDSCKACSEMAGGGSGMILTLALAQLLCRVSGNARMDGGSGGRSGLVLPH